FVSSRTHTSPTIINLLKCIGKYNHIRAKLILIYCLKRPTLVDDKSKEPQEIGLPNHFSLVYEAVSKVVAQNVSEAAPPYHQNLVYSKTGVA
ncbi:unnamed protein product, partial [Hymenolepis diminuta]